MRQRRRRLAAVLRQLSGPPSTCLSSPSVAAPPTEQSAGWWADPEQVAATFQRQGFLLLDNWIEGAELHRAQDAYMRACAPCWQSARRGMAPSALPTSTRSHRRRPLGDARMWQ